MTKSIFENERSCDVHNCDLPHCSVCRCHLFDKDGACEDCEAIAATNIGNMTPEDREKWNRASL